MFIKILMHVKYGPASQQNEYRQNEKSNSFNTKVLISSQNPSEDEVTERRGDGKFDNFNFEYLKLTLIRDY